MALLPVAEALARILSSANPTGVEQVDLMNAPGRTLANPLVASIDGPPFDASAMDGYAVYTADAATSGARLRLAGVSAAGRPYTGRIDRGDAVRIFTGAMIPEGADTVVIQENAAVDGGNVSFDEAPHVGQNIRRRGEDFRAGASVIDKGQRLGSRDILLAAAAGHAKLDVARKPVVAILSTGDELREPGTPLRPGQIPASNGYALAALVEAAGGSPRLLPVAGDTLEALKAAIASAADADILLTIGGASVGDHDLVRPALEQSGAALDFYKIAMRPGKPLFFGTRKIHQRTQHCLGLPGNPVSALICARVFLVPFIARMLERDDPLEPFDAIAATSIPANGPREQYMRGMLDTSTVPPRAHAFESQDSGRVSTLQKANCLIVVSADAPTQPAGSTIKVLRLDF
jgi:molybdopterin molybdotransferase